MLHYVQGQNLPWQSGNMEAGPADPSDSEDASDSDDDTFTMEDLFGETTTEPEEGDSDDETLLQVTPGPSRPQPGQAASRLQEAAADLLDHLMGPQGVRAKRKRRRSRSPPATGSVSVLPQAQSPRVFSILMKHGHLLTQVSREVRSCRAGNLALPEDGWQVPVRQLWMPVSNAVVADVCDSSTTGSGISMPLHFACCLPWTVAIPHLTPDLYLEILHRGFFCMLVKLGLPTAFGLDWHELAQPYRWHSQFHVYFCKM